MTTPTETQETTTTTQAVAKDISDPALSFADYQALRRGEKVEHSSAPDPKGSEHKAAAKPGTAETKGKEANPREEDDETKDDADEADDKVTNSETDKPRKKGGFQRRIDKLNARASAAEREAEHWKNLANQGKGAGEPKADKVETAKAQEGKPNSDSFDTHAEYVEALTDWKIDQKAKADAAKDQKSKLEAQRETLAKSHAERVKAFVSKHPDFEEVLSEVDDVFVSPTFQEVVLTSDHGPALMYELAKNPEEYKRIATLPPLAAARELGKIEAKFASETTSEAKEESEVKPESKKLTTKAPKPIEPVGKGTAAVRKSIDDPDLSFSDYERLRREQLKRKRG